MARTRKPLRGQGSIIVISAPSGAGKSTLVRRLMQAAPALAFSVSYTTRGPRPGEKDGREYYFVSRRRFERMASRGEFVEWAEVFGHLYGTSKRQLRAAQRAGKDILLDIDVQGHSQIRKKLPEAVSVFVLPPSRRELQRRLQRRHLDPPREMARRLADARQELCHWPEYDFLVVNDRLIWATHALQAVVQAARFRVKNQVARACAISRTFGG